MSEYVSRSMGRTMDHRKRSDNNLRRARFVEKVEQRRFIRTAVSQATSMGLRNRTSPLGRGRPGVHDGVQHEVAVTTRPDYSRTGYSPEGVERSPHREHKITNPDSGIVNRFKRYVYYLAWGETPEETYRRYLRDLPIEADHFYRHIKNGSKS